MDHIVEGGFYIGVQYANNHDPIIRRVDSIEDGDVYWTEFNRASDGIAIDTGSCSIYSFERGSFASATPTEIRDLHIK
jgi:hypothetical protein